jgi:hypothetical protein
MEIRKETDKRSENPCPGSRICEGTRNQAVGAGAGGTTLLGLLILSGFSNYRKNKTF